MKYRRKTEIVSAERIDNHGWLVTKDDGSIERVPEYIFHLEYELIPNIQRIMSRQEPHDEFVAIRFDGATPGNRLMSMDMIQRWDTELDWDAANDRITHILSGCGTYWIPAGYWLIYRGKEFLFQCTHEYFCDRFTFIEE